MAHYHAAAVARWYFKVTMLKDTGFGLVLEVQMSKNGTPPWRETHFQFKM